MNDDGARAAEFIEKVRIAFPALTWEVARYVGHGWDHDVLVLDHSLVLRAPKDERYRTEFAREIALLDHLNDLVGLPIPHYTLVAPDRLVAGYRMLPGVELTPDLLEGLGAGDRRHVVCELAHFLSVLHAIPRVDLEQYQIRTEDELSLFEQLRERVAMFLSSRLKRDELSLIEEFLERVPGHIASKYDPVLVHCDLTPDHILWDAPTRTVSVIDFSDRAYGDPARDFAGLFGYGADFVREVVDRYEGQKDGLVERAELYHKRIALWLMIDAIEGFPCSFEDGYRMFQRSFAGCGACGEDPGSCRPPTVTVE